MILNIYYAGEKFVFGRELIERPMPVILISNEQFEMIVPVSEQFFAVTGMQEIYSYRTFTKNELENFVRDTVKELIERMELYAIYKNTEEINEGHK